MRAVKTAIILFLLNLLCLFNEVEKKPKRYKKKTGSVDKVMSGVWMPQLVLISHYFSQIYSFASLSARTETVVIVASTFETSSEQSS